MAQQQDGTNPDILRHPALSNPNSGEQPGAEGISLRLSGSLGLSGGDELEGEPESYSEGLYTGMDAYTYALLKLGVDVLREPVIDGDELVVTVSSRKTGDSVKSEDSVEIRLPMPEGYVAIQLPDILNPLPGAPLRNGKMQLGRVSLAIIPREAQALVEGLVDLYRKLKLASDSLVAKHGDSIIHTLVYLDEHSEYDVAELTVAVKEGVSLIEFGDEGDTIPFEVPSGFKIIEWADELRLDPNAHESSEAEEYNNFANSWLLVPTDIAPEFEKMHHEFYEILGSMEKLLGGFPTRYTL